MFKQVYFSSSFTIQAIREGSYLVTFKMEDGKKFGIDYGFDFAPKTEQTPSTENEFICTKCSPTFRDERALQQHHINNHVDSYRCRVKVNIPETFHEKSKLKLMTGGKVPVKINKLSMERNHILYLTPYKMRTLAGWCQRSSKKTITFYFSKRQAKYNLLQKDGYLHYLLTNAPSLECTNIDKSDENHC